MKILYFINCSGNGAGGHYHSLDQVSNEMSKQNEVHIISLGINPSPVISKNKAFYKHIEFKSIKDFFSSAKQIKEALANLKPDILHFFDNESLNNYLLVIRQNKLPIVLNKCGGPNPNKEKWQFADGIVLFSYENYNWFKNNTNYKQFPIFLIPNRVQKLEFLAVDQRVETKNSDEITFVRVTRLGGAYEKTLLDTFNLIKHLSEKYALKLVVIGKIQDPNRFELLKNAGLSLKINVEYITDERASKGAQFLYLGDFVIGTGRSMMEAMSLGIPCLAPASNADMPMLITPNNFNYFFDANFSERAVADVHSLDNNIRNIELAMADQNFYSKTKQETEALFESELSTKHILTKYSNVYSSVIEKKVRFNLYFKNLPYLILFAIKAIKKSRSRK